MNYADLQVTTHFSFLRGASERLFLVLLHFYVAQNPAPLAPGSFVRPLGIGGAPDDRGIDVFAGPR
jgi:hypothetical protein